MKWVLVVLLVTSSTSGLERGMGVMCVGAQFAVLHATAATLAQERHTPKGEWCQRPAPQMSKKAHSCSCHKADCADADPNHLPAHTDSKCENFCNTKDCRCAVHDCL